MDILVNGVLLGLGYCLIGIGLAIILGVAKVFDLAYGIYYMLAPYVALMLIGLIGAAVPNWFAFIAGIGASLAFALVIHNFVIFPIHKQHTAVFVSTMAVGIVIQELLLFKEGSEPVHLPAVLKGATSLLGVIVTDQKILVAGVTLIVLGLLWLFLTKTRLGLAIRATAQEPEAMLLAGGNIKLIFLLAAILAAIVAAIGGLLLSPIYAPHPLIWLDMLLIAFAVTVLGGLGNIWGCLPAALILGISETAFAVYVPHGSIIKRTVGFLIILLTLILRPGGLFGVRGWEEES